jgi:carbon monoxide dehydrogenase subunit G
MPSITMKRTIAAPILRVWEIFTDIAAAEDRLSAVEKIEMLSSGPFGEGTRWRETRTLYGKSTAEELWVSHFEPQQSYTVEAGATNTHYQSRYDFGRIDDSKTSVTFTFSGESRGNLAVVGRLMWPLIRRKLTKDLRRDLDDLALICER